MSSFDEHVLNHRRRDGSYDLDAAEEDFRHVLENDPDALLKYAARTARQERRTWTDKETSTLRKQFAQPALSPALELDAMVPLGDGTAVRFGDMNRARIAARKDMRLRVHVDELRAFETEMSFWLHVEKLIEGDETIEDAVMRHERRPPRLAHADARSLADRHRSSGSSGPRPLCAPRGRRVWRAGRPRPGPPDRTRSAAEADRLPAADGECRPRLVAEVAVSVPERHPLGRSCGKAVPLVLLLMPYALARYGIDEWRARPYQSS